jgi:type IV pilus assembly protein PilN
MLVFILLSLGVWAAIQSNSIDKLTAENNKVQEEKKKYSKILDEIKRLEKEKNELLTKIDVINKLKESSSLTVRVLDEVATFTPPDRMWLKNLSQSGNSLTLTGMALDDQTVAKYMDDLEQSKFLSNVVLMSSAMEIFAERNLKTFSISSSVGFENTEKNETNKSK